MDTTPTVEQILALAGCESLEQLRGFVEEHKEPPKLAHGELITRSGLRVDPLEPEAWQIQIEDMAWALSTLNRWGGHTHVPVSVLVHSIHVVQLLRWANAPEDEQRAGLVHDLLEGLHQDLIFPIKHRLRRYKRYTTEANLTLQRRYGVDLTLPAVDLADQQSLSREYHTVCFQDEQGWAFLLHVPPDAPPLPQLDTAEALHIFMCLAIELRLFTPRACGVVDTKLANSECILRGHRFDDPELTRWGRAIVRELARALAQKTGTTYQIIVTRVGLQTIQVEVQTDNATVARVFNTEYEPTKELISDLLQSALDCC